MRIDGHDQSRFVPRAAMPAVDHEATGPLSALVRLTNWVGRLRQERAERALGRWVAGSRR